MKKKNFFYLLLVLSLLAAGVSCGKGKEKNPDKENQKQENTEEENPEEENTEEENPEEEEYIPGYDDNRREVRYYDIEDSFLYIVKGLFIYCIDLETGEAYPVCSKPSCLHDSSSCNAYSVNFMISAYQGQLITAGHNYIYSHRMDGSGYETLGRYETEAKFGESVSQQGGSCMVHRGYIYLGYCRTTATEVKIRFLRMPVSGGDVEILYEQPYPITGEDKIEDWEKWYMDSYYGVGSKVYFAAQQGNTGNIHCYNTQTGKVTSVHEMTGGMSQIYPSGGNWYWRTADGMKIICWNPKTDEEKCIFTYPRVPGEGGIMYTRFYEDGFSILDEAGNPRLFVFYDWEGQYVTEKELSSVPNPGSLFPEGHIGQYMVCTYSDGGKVFALLDTDRLGDPNLEWMLYRLTPKE